MRRDETRRGEARRGEERRREERREKERKGEQRKERKGEERRGEERRGEERRVTGCGMLDVVCCVCGVFVFCVGFPFCCVLCGCSCGALLYESPGGNQVDGLPPAFHNPDLFDVRNCSMCFHVEIHLNLMSNFQTQTKCQNSGNCLER